MTEETPPLVTNSDDNPWILRIFPNPDPHRTGTSPSYLWGTISYHPHNVRDPESTTSGILSPQCQGSWVHNVRDLESTTSGILSPQCQGSWVHNVRDPESTTSGILSPQCQGSWVHNVRDPESACGLGTPDVVRMISYYHCAIVVFYFIFQLDTIWSMFYFFWNGLNPW